MLSLEYLLGIMGWNDDDCLLVLSVLVEGLVFKYFYIFLLWGEELSFFEIVL